MAGKPEHDCSDWFHHTTAMGYCSRCGKSWKHHRRRARPDGPDHPADGDAVPKSSA